jgi:Haemolysin XhlA
MEALEVNTTEKEILMSLARLETKMDNLGNVKEVSNEALQSSKNAHLRIDRIDKIIFWAGTTTIGGVVIGAIGLLFYFAKN